LPGFLFGEFARPKFGDVVVEDLYGNILRNAFDHVCSAVLESDLNFGHGWLVWELSGVFDVLSATRG
jgi:hypothetical protein